MLTPASALARAEKVTAYPAGLCLEFVCDNFEASGNPHGVWPTALSGWEAHPDHPGQWPTIPGVPVYFTGVPGDPDGHVCHWVDPLHVYSTYTDSAGVGHAGILPISTILVSWGRKLLGWSNSLVGNPIDLTQTTGGGTVTPVTPNKPTTVLDGIELPKVISVPNGTIALVTELSGHDYTTPVGGQGFSIGSNIAAYGEVTGLTEDQVSTLVNEANLRGQAFAAQVAAAIK